MSLSRRIAPRSVVPDHLQRQLANHGVCVTSGGMNDWLSVFINLANGVGRAQASAGSEPDRVRELALGPEALAEIAALAEHVWAVDPPWCGHQTEVGAEEIAVVDGDSGCYVEARGGWFTEGHGKALMDRMRALAA